MSTFPEQAGQMLFIGFEGQSLDTELAHLLRSIRPGGVIFFQRNIASAEEFRGLAREIRGVLGPSTFFAIDQEGGSVDRLRDAVAPLPAVREVARSGLGREFGRIAGRELAAFSLDIDFAPVLDLASPESESILGSRTAGSSPADVVRFAEEFLLGLAEQGIAGCGKHFPGLGGARKDSHHALPCIDTPEAEMWSGDLLPFGALADRLPMIMVAHAEYPALERSVSHSSGPDFRPLPASLSPHLVTGLLKGKMSYGGLVLCDDLEMGAVLEDRTLEEATVAAVRAGCDLLLVCRRAENVQRAFDALLRESGRNAGFRTLLEKAAQKILRAKQMLLASRKPAPLADCERLRQEILDFTDKVSRSLEPLSPQQG